MWIFAREGCAVGGGSTTVPQVDEPDPRGRGVSATNEVVGMDCKLSCQFIPGLSPCSHGDNVGEASPALGGERVCD